jgi:hypothetical protein
MGEAKRRQLAVQTQALEAMVVDTPGGRIHVKWDHGASATPNAQLTFFSEFLATTGVYSSWRCLWVIGKPIWLVSLLLWMRAARSLSGDWTANRTANRTAPCLPSQLINTHLSPLRIWQTRPAMLWSVRQKIARPFTY